MRKEEMYARQDEIDKEKKNLYHLMGELNEKHYALKKQLNELSLEWHELFYLSGCENPENPTEEEKKRIAKIMKSYRKNYEK